MNNQKNYVQQIKSEYTPKQANTKLDQLKALDKKAKVPAYVFAYTYGSVGALVLGTGMCLAMKVIGMALSFAMPLGIGVGLVGIALVSTTYPIFKKMLDSRKKKYADQILKLTEEM